MALDLDSVRAFLKVAELNSFTRAAAQLGVSKSRVSTQLSELESDLGCRLLQRSTRTVQLTADGEQFLTRAQRLAQDAEELSTMFSAPSTLKGRLRIDLPVNLAKDRIIPRLPEFLAAHPLLEVQLSTTDRRVDVLREGFDCVLRVGALDDSTLVAKRLGALAMMNCASPAYLVRYGMPKTLADLDGHLLVNYSSRLGAEAPVFEYREGPKLKEKAMRSVIAVNNVEAYHAACLAGFGLVQVPRSSMLPTIAAGTLVEVLPQFTSAPLPVSLVHGYSRTVPERVRAFMQWLGKVLATYLAESAPGPG